MAKKKPTTKKKPATKRKPKAKRPVFGFHVKAQVKCFDISKIVDP